MNKFRELLSQVDWTNIYITTDANESYNAFISKYTRQFEFCFRLKRTTRKQLDRLKTPWLTKGLRKSIKHKNRLYKAFIKSPSTLRESHYKNFRDKLTHLIRRAKRTYYDGKFERTKNDLKSTWKLINEIINKRNSKRAMTSTFKADANQ